MVNCFSRNHPRLQRSRFLVSAISAVGANVSQQIGAHWLLHYK